MATSSRKVSPKRPPKKELIITITRSPGPKRPQKKELIISTTRSPGGGTGESGARQHHQGVKFFPFFPSALLSEPVFCPHGHKVAAVAPSALTGTGEKKELSPPQHPFVKARKSFLSHFTDQDICPSLNSSLAKEAGLP